jgi:amidase
LAGSQHTLSEAKQGAYQHETEAFIMTLGSARPMEDAARVAYRELVRWMVNDYGFDVYDAYFLLTQAGRVRLGNVVDPKYTLGASILKRYLPPYP